MTRWCLSSLALALAGCSPLIGLIVREAESGDASDLRAGSSVSGSTLGASDVHQPSCGAPQGGGDRSFVFVPDQSGVYRFDLNANYDCVLALYDDAGQSIDCNDDSGSVSHSMIERSLEAGRSYRLVVDGYGSASGNFELSATFVSGESAPPEVSAPLSSNPPQIAGTLGIGAPAQGDTRNAGDAITPPCGSRPGSPDQHWSFTPPRTGTYQLQVDADYDSVLAIYPQGSQTPVGCNDDHGSTRVSLVMAQLNGGSSYDVVVDGFGGASGTYVLRANEIMSMPPGVIGVLQLVRGDTQSGTDTETPSCGSAPGSRDQVWTFTPAQDGMYRMDVSAEYDAVLALYGPNGELACNDDFNTTRESRLEFTLRAGQSYRVVIDGYQGQEGAYQLQITSLTPSGQVIQAQPVQTPPALVENIGAVEARCASAPPLPIGVTRTSFGFESNARTSCDASPGSERIYRIEVTQPSQLRVMAQSPRQPVVEIRSGCSRGHSVVLCDAGRGSTSGIAYILRPGTYYLFVDSRIPGGDDPFELTAILGPASP